MKPDLNTEELIEKRKKQEKVKEFSKQLRRHNQEQLLAQPKQIPASEQVSIEISTRKEDSKRTKMLEFAKNIPKPIVSSISAINSASNNTQQVSQNRKNRSEINSSRVSSEYDSSSGPGVSSKARGVGVSGGMYIPDEEIEAARLDELERKHLMNKKKLEDIKKSLKM